MSELDQRLTYDEMQNLQRYAYENGGISPRRHLERVIRESAAYVCLTMASIHGPKGKRFKLADFMPKQPDIEVTADNEVEMITSLLRSVSGGKRSGGSSGIKWKRKPSTRG